jgi:AcrR family transcriptional regulator
LGSDNERRDREQLHHYRRHEVPGVVRPDVGGDREHGAGHRSGIGANLASIAYHFGSKDDLVTEAVIEGLDRWLAEIESALATVGADDPVERYARTSEVIEATRRRHLGLARNFLGALAKAQHDPRVAEGFRHTRPNVAAVLGLGDDEAGIDAAGLVHSMFVGLLFQQLIDPALAIDGERLEHAKLRLRRVLPR